MRMNKKSILLSACLLAGLINFHEILAAEANTAERIHEIDENANNSVIESLKIKAKGKEVVHSEPPESSKIKNDQLHKAVVGEPVDLVANPSEGLFDARKLENWIKKILHECSYWDKEFLEIKWPNSPRLDEEFHALLRDLGSALIYLVRPMLAGGNIKVDKFDGDIGDATVFHKIFFIHIFDCFAALTKKFDSYGDMKPPLNVNAWLERKKWTGLLIEFFTGVHSFTLFPKVDLPRLLNEERNLRALSDVLFSQYEFPMFLAEDHNHMIFNIPLYLSRHPRSENIRDLLHMLESDSWKKITFRFLIEQLEYFEQEKSTVEPFSQFEKEFRRLASPDEDLDPPTREHFLNLFIDKLLNDIVSPSFYGNCQPDVRKLGSYFLTYNILSYTTTYLKSDFLGLEKLEEARKSSLVNKNNLKNERTEVMLEKVKLFEETLGLLASILHSGQIRYSMIFHDKLSKQELTSDLLSNMPFVFRVEDEFAEFGSEYPIISNSYIYSKHLTNMEITNKDKIDAFAEQIQSSIPNLVKVESKKEMIASSINKTVYLYRRREAQKLKLLLMLPKFDAEGMDEISHFHTSHKFINSLDKLISWAVESIEKVEKFI